MTRKAAQQAYEEAQLGPEDVQVIELHDCFSANELITYEALGLCGEGEGHKLVEAQDTTYGGRWVVNPSGGLISKGHPLGATGLAQCSELTWQLRGHVRGPSGRGRQSGAAAQHRPRRRRGRDRVSPTCLLSAPRGGPRAPRRPPEAGLRAGPLIPPN